MSQIEWTSKIQVSPRINLHYFSFKYCWVCVVMSVYSWFEKLDANSFAILWTLAQQAPLSMGFPRQEYWSGLPFPSLGDLPDPRIEWVVSCFAGRFLTTDPPGKSFEKLGYPLKIKLCLPPKWPQVSRVVVISRMASEGSQASPLSELSVSP